MVLEVDKEVRATLTKLVKEHGSQRAVARKLGISEQYMTDLMKNRRRPGPRVLKGLGFRRVEQYIKNGDAA